jgi:hypothetical protein
MKNIIIILLLLISISGYSQVTKINYWTWKSNHTIQSPEKWNRYDYWNYMPRYYVVPTISFSLKPFRYLKPSNYFYYKERNRKYKFIF